MKIKKSIILQKIYSQPLPAHLKRAGQKTYPKNYHNLTAAEVATCRQKSASLLKILGMTSLSKST